MKKTIPVFLAGILFAVTFIGLIQVARVTGIWVSRGEREGYEERYKEGFHGGKPAGDAEDGGSESEALDRHDDIQAQIEHFNKMKISDFCQLAGIDSNCALSKLGLNYGQLGLSLSEVAKIKNTSIANLVTSLETCQSGGVPDREDSKGGDN